MSHLIRLLLPLLLALQGVATAQEGVPRVDLTARFEPAKAAAGQKVTLVLEGVVHEGYHLYGKKQESGNPPTLTPGAGSVAVLQPTGAFQVPDGTFHVDPDFPDDPNWWIEGKTEFRQEFTVVAGATPGRFEWKGELGYVACTPELCDPPFSQTVTAALEVVAGGAPAPQGKGEKTETAEKKVAPSSHEGNHQTLELILKPGTSRAGETVKVVVRTEMEPGWHNYGAKQKLEFGRPVTFKLKKGAYEPIGEPLIPPGKLHVADGMELHELEGTFETSQEIRVPKDSKPGGIPVEVDVSYYACDENFCENEVKVTLGAVLTVEAGAARQERAAVAPPQVADGGGQTVDKMSLGRYLLLAIGAGLFALIMPCTYPMIPITISFFTKQAEQRGGSALGLALFYGFGIIASFVLVGGIVAVSGFDMLAFATNGWVNLVLCGLFVFFALSLFGIVELRPPSFMMNTASKASTVGGPLGVFLMGVTLCISSFACTAPFLGTMLAAGAGTGSKALLLLGMGVFGLTMALPFVILSLVPGRLPRGGGWMNTAKVVFGFVELAAALKFFSITDVSWNLEMLPRELFLMIWAGLFAVCGLYTLGFIKLKGETGEIGGGRLVTGVATVVFAFYCAHGAMGYQLNNEVMVAFEPPYRAVNLDGGAKGKTLSRHEIVKDDFDTAVKIAQRDDKLLLVNFTGYN